jgi:hypothetical protein
MNYPRLIILIAVFLFLQGIHLDAQVSIGVNAGLNRSSLSGDSPSNGSFGPILGSMAGLRLDYRINQAVAISLQPGYINQGANFVKVDSNNRVSDSLQFKLGVLALPIHAVVWSKNGRFFVSAGLEFDYYLTAKAKYEDGSTDIKSELKSYNIFAQFGGGLMISLGSSYLLFEMRYSQGLIDINNPLVHDKGYLPRTKLTGLYFMAGFNIPLGKESHYKIQK